MTDLQQRFAQIDRVPVPDVWVEVQHRAQTPAMSATQPRVSGGRGQIDLLPRRRPMFGQAFVVLVLVALAAAVVAGGFGLGSWLNRATPTPTPTASDRPTPLSSSAPQSPAGLLHRFVATGLMSTGRMDHAAVRLSDGRVLITGGTHETEGNDVTVRGTTGSLDSSEIYDPAQGVFTVTASMLVPRSGHTATLLADGRVLVAGGGNVLGPASDPAQTLASAEIYDPATDTFTGTGMMTAARSDSANLLPDGRVLIARIAGGPNLTQVVSVDLFDPVTGTFSPTAMPLQADGAEWLFTGLLNDGRVLFIVTSRMDLGGTDVMSIYDPALDSFSPVHLANNVVGFALAMSNGSVLLAEESTSIESMFSALLVDPLSGSVRPTGPEFDFSVDSATALEGGDVLLLGITGRQDRVPRMGLAELYSANSGTFSPLSEYRTARAQPRATLLSDGSVLITGGGGNLGGGLAFASAELFK